MGVAKLSAMRSKDPGTQVGCCIATEDNKIASLGYNGFPIGCSDDEFPWNRDNKDPLENKYYYIDFVKDEEDEMLERNKFLNYRYGYVHNYYSVVFFEEEVPEVEYKIYAKHSLIKKEILHMKTELIIKL